MLTAARLLTGLRSLVLLPVFARLVGTGGYGVFTQAVVVTALLTPVLTLQLGSAAVRLFAGSEDSSGLREGFLGSLVPVTTVALALTGAMALFPAQTAQVIFGDASLAELVTPVAFVVFSSTLFDYLREYFRVKERMVAVASVNTGTVALETAGIVAVLLLGAGLVAALWVLALARVTGAVALYVYVGSKIGWFGFDRARLRTMLAYAAPLIPSGFLMWTVAYADRTLIAQLIDINAVGVYAASYSVAAIVAIPTTALGYVLFPRLSSLWGARRQSEAGRLFSEALKAYWMVALPAAVFLVYVSQPLIRVLAGESFETSAALVAWVAVGVIFQGMFQTSIYGLYIGMKTRSVTGLTLLGAVLNVALNLVLIPQFGLIGAAIATAASFGPMGVIGLILGSKAIDARPAVSVFGKTTAAAGALAIGLSLLRQESLIGAGLVGLGGLVVYALLILALRVTSVGEIRALMAGNHS